MAKPDAQAVAAMDRQTTEVGLFNFADSYLICAKHLSSQEIKQLRFGDPIEYLYYHSIELFLKSFLRWKGTSAYDLSQRPYGHNLEKLLADAVTQGLSLDTVDVNNIIQISSSSAVIESRYIVTGYKQILPIGSLSQTAMNLRDAVNEGMTTGGVTLRPASYLSDMQTSTMHQSILEGNQDDE